MTGDDNLHIFTVRDMEEAIQKLNYKNKSGKEKKNAFIDTATRMLLH